MAGFLCVTLLFVLIAATVATNHEGRDHEHLGRGRPVMKTGSDGLQYPLEDSDYWNTKCQAELVKQLAKTPLVSKARNVILFLGDGASISTFTAARLLKGQRTGDFEQQEMAWETFPYSSLIKTYNTDSQVTGSASSSTAYLGGVKANQHTIGVDVNVLRADCDAMNNPKFHVHSILKNFQDGGRATGLVTVTRVTHASPAGNYAHTAERTWENDADVVGEDAGVCADIAQQLVAGPTGEHVKVILGGGRQKFLPENVVDPEGGVGGRRLDNRDLVEEWLEGKAAIGVASYVWNRTELLELDTSELDYLLGLFDYSHMEYAINNETSNPSLEEMTQVAIEILQKDRNGFYLFVEGGNIDRAHHLNEARSALEETLEFEKAVQVALDMTAEEDTLVIVVADHSQPFVINGYPPRGTDIFGLADVSDVDGLPFTTLMYTNGPGYRGEVHGSRPDPSQDGYEEIHYVSAATVPNGVSNHAGEDVALFARGPHAFLFTGIHENAYIPHAIRYAACVGDGLSFCSEKTVNE